MSSPAIVLPRAARPAPPTRGAHSSWPFANSVTVLATTHRFSLALALVATFVFATAIPVSAAQASAKLDTATIDRYVEEQRQAQRIPGVALGIVKDGEIVHLRGYGSADVSGRAVTPKTPFIVGSLTKSFTGVAVMQLAED